MSHFNDAMRLLAAQPGALFFGQSVAYTGTAMYSDLEGIPMSQRIEFPVAEELQLGCCTGLSLMGYLPIAIFPRCDFLMRAMDQLVLHLDKLEQMSRGQFKPKVIIRTRVGSKTPLDAGPQHTNDFTNAFRAMLTSVVVSKIEAPGDIMPIYQQAIQTTGSTLIVEAF